MTSAATGRRAILVMCAALLLNMVGFSNYGAVLPGIIADLHLTAAEAGFAGGIFFLSYAIGSPLCSVLTDVVDPKRLYIAGCIAALAGGLFFPWASESYGALLVGRAGRGRLVQRGLREQRAQAAEPRGTQRCPVLAGRRALRWRVGCTSEEGPRRQRRR